MALQGLYRSCATLPLFNFIEVFDSQDLRYLFKCDKEDWPELEGDEIEDVWSGIIDEYTELTADPSYRNELNKESQILRDINHVNTAKASLLILKHGSIVADDALKELGYVVNDEKDIKRILTALKQKTTSIAIRKNKIDQAKTKKKVDLYKHVAIVESEQKREINLYTTTVKKWVAILKTMNDARSNKKG